MRVLIAEDQEVTQQYLHKMLTSWGYQPMLCANGQEAWEVLTGPQPPRLVLLDWMMPGMDGLEICRRLRQHVISDSTYVILVTGRGGKQDLLDGLEAGADDYLTKPFDIKELRARLTIGERVIRRLQGLEEREAILQDFIDHADQLIQLVGADGRFVHVNKAWRDCLGYNAEEVDALNIWDIVHPANMDHCRALAECILQGQDVGSVEARFITKDGRTVIVEGSSSYGPEDGRPKVIRSIFRDITEKARHQALETAIEKVRSEVWKMQTVADIGNVLTGLAQALQGLEIDFVGCGFNLVGMNFESVGMQFCHYQDAEGIKSWEFEPGSKGQQLIERIWKKGDVAYRVDLEKDDPYGERDYFSRAYAVGIRSVLDIPFKYGTLAVNSSAPDAFSAADINAMSAIAQVLSEGFQRLGDLERLAASEARYRTLVETPQFGVLLLDLDGRCLYANPKMGEWTGHGAEVFYTAQYLQQQLTEPLYRQGCIKAFAKAKRGVSTEAMEFVLLHKDGSTRWVSGACFPVRVPTGRVDGVQVVLQDINDRKRMEEEHEQLDMQLHDLRLLYRLRTGLETARSPEEAIAQTGKVLEEVLSGFVDAGAVISYRGREWCFGAPFREGLHRFEEALRWGDQEHGRFLLYCRVELDPLQRQTLVDSVAAQLGHALEARELELQLLQSSRLVSLGEMAAGVAHELNQPLAAISATAEGIILRQDAGIALPVERQYQMMEHVLQMVERMSGIIGQLRIFARDTAVDRGLPFSLNQMVGDSLKMIQTQLRNRGIEVRTDLQEALPRVEGHAAQLSQVLVNLLANARDAFGEAEHGVGQKERVIQIRTRFVSGAMEQVLLEVEDNGVGIPDAVKERIFEPFFTTKDEDLGTGLGLSISYAIVRNHGGRLQCRSRLGEGAVFSIFLPQYNDQSQNRALSLLGGMLTLQERHADTN